jgi:hypothetical protein
MDFLVVFKNNVVTDNVSRGLLMLRVPQNSGHESQAGSVPHNQVVLRLHPCTIQAPGSHAAGGCAAVTRAQP